MQMPSTTPPDSLLRSRTLLSTYDSDAFSEPYRLEYGLYTETWPYVLTLTTETALFGVQL